MIRAIIVDDEAPARSELPYLLDETGEVEVVDEAADVHQALEQLKEHGADLMFLDIKMPGISGLHLAEALGRLKKPPQIIFVTAYAEHALRAFDLDAVDYLVKPVEVDRLRQALAKVGQQGGDASTQKVERIMVEKGGRKLLLPVTDIQFIMAKDDYSYMHAGAERYLSTTSLAQLEERLTPHGFFRVHRRYLVNLDAITQLTPQPGGTLLLTLKDQEEPIPVSRRRVASLKKAIAQ
jgi:two-component system response regulator LytT